MNLSMFADQTRREEEEEEEGIICGTILRAEPSATALLLPDHNQMCQVCPNRNDCVKAIFSNLSDFRVAPTPPSLSPRPKPPERQIQTLEEHNNHFKLPPMNARCTLSLQRSHVMRDIQYNSRTHRGKTRPVVLTNNHPPNFHASALLNLAIRMHSAFIYSLLVESKSLTTFTHPESIILTHSGRRNQNKEREINRKKVVNLSPDTS